MSSATADPSSTAMSGAADAAAVNDSARLGQPTDAVAMNNIGQTADLADEKVVEGDQTLPSDATAAALKPTTATAAAAVGEQVITEETDTMADKGKEKDITDARPAGLAERQESVMAIGPAQDEIKAINQGPSDGGPVCTITLLLTTGSRHPYKIDAKYLTRRNVAIPEETETGLPDPFSISIYTLKELILREWRSDWEAKPASPSSIRLIHFGKLLDDKEPLRKYQFTVDSPNVVHMSVRPQDLDEEEPKTGGKNASSSGGDGTRQRSGGCCVIL